MLQTVVVIAWAAVGVYLLCGVLFAAAFHVAGARRIDPATRGAGLMFQVLVTPGVVALWPVLAEKWRRAAAGRSTQGPVHRPLSAESIRHLHRRLALVLIVVVPLGAAAGLALRPVPWIDPSARQLLPEKAPLPLVLAEDDNALAPLPVVLRLRADAESKALQVEIEAAADLERPALALSWIAQVDSAPETAEHLGSLWGPGVRRYRLPQRAITGGLLVVHSLATGERVATFEMPAISPPPAP